MAGEDDEPAAAPARESTTAPAVSAFVRPVPVMPVVADEPAEPHVPVPARPKKWQPFVVGLAVGLALAVIGGLVTLFVTAPGKP